MKVMVDPDRCEGHARCVELAPEVFALNDEGLSTVLLDHPGEELRAKVEAAVRLCPRQAILLTEDRPPAGAAR
jgi:ferredoxin